MIRRTEAEQEDFLGLEENADAWVDCLVARQTFALYLFQTSYIGYTIKL